MSAQKRRGDSILNEMLSASKTIIIFENPDSNFIGLPDASGYRCGKITAFIKAIILPGDYASAEMEFKKLEINR